MLSWRIASGERTVMGDRDDDGQVDPGMTVVSGAAARAVMQPDSTVSTTVLREEGVRLVVFAFDSGQELSEHTAAVPVLLQPLSGRLAVAPRGGRSRSCPATSST
jgi:hypothetical protein